MAPVPPIILPRGQVQTPFVLRQAPFCGTVLNRQSKSVSRALTAKAGMAEVVGSSPPASSSNTLQSACSLSRPATTDPEHVAAFTLDLNLYFTLFSDHSNVDS